jgi:fructokinase
MADIVCLGELLMDFFPAEIGRPLLDVTAFRPVPGGAPANVAVAAARLGAHSAFIGKVGDDPFGHHLADVLRREGVNVQGMRYDPAVRTTVNFLAQPDANSYTCLFYRNPGADMMLAAGDLDVALLRRARALHFGSLSLAQEPSRSATVDAIRLARQSGALISFDVNYRPTLWANPSAARQEILAVVPLVDMLKMNEAEAELLSGQTDPDRAALAMIAQGPNVCVVTVGPGGSYARTATAAVHTPAFAVQTVDATGCGDAFIAGLLHRLLAGANWQTQIERSALAASLRYASAVAALTATKRGVIPALPWRAEVESFLAIHS